MHPSQEIRLMTREADWSILICLLGSFRLLKSGKPVVMRNAGKTQSLLSNLALAQDHCIGRETLVQTLWPETETALASQSLNSLVYSLRKLLGDQIGGAPPVVQSDGYYRLNMEAGVGLDIAWFKSLANEGEEQARKGNLGEAMASYRYAIELYRGDLCVNGDINALMERERLRALYLTLLARLAADSYGNDDCSACLNHAIRLLAADPCREDAHRLVMRCYVRQGERAQAFRHYHLCETVLRAELDAAPEPATVALYDQIRLEPGSV